MSDRTNNNISDIAINGPLEKDNIINLLKLHGSVSYPLDHDMTFTVQELNRVFFKNQYLYNNVVQKLSTKPTIFWGTRLADNDVLNSLAESDEVVNSQMSKWIVVYPSQNMEEEIEEYRDLGLNIIIADTKELLQYLGESELCANKQVNENNYKYYAQFPNNYICKKQLDSVQLDSVLSRPVVEFLQGAEPRMSDVLSENVKKTSYYYTILNKLVSEKDQTILITGIPGCGKTTLLMQLAISEEIKVPKFFFSNILKTEAEKLVKITSRETKVIVFLDNLYNNIDAFEVLKKQGNIKLIIAERALNYEFVKRYLDISSEQIVDVSNLKFKDIKLICTSLNRSENLATSIMKHNKNISLLEIVFFVFTKSELTNRIGRYIKDLKAYTEDKLKINLLELYALVNYTSACGVPITMDMLYAYFDSDIEKYDDIYYALSKMKQIIVSTDDKEFTNDNNQDFWVIRSKLFAEKSLNLIPREVFASMLERFIKTIHVYSVCRYDIFRKRAYDADFTKRAFSKVQGIKFYEEVLKQNKSPYVKHQYAIFLHRFKDINKAWAKIDEAYTESKHKIFSIANTHAIIMFEKNMRIDAKGDAELKLQKEIIEQSFLTLEYCMDRDIRAAYHVLIYARNSYEYYLKFGIDEFTLGYITKSISQINDILNSKDYIFKTARSEMKSLLSNLNKIRSL